MPYGDISIQLIDPLYILIYLSSIDIISIKLNEIHRSITLIIISILPT